MKLISVIIPTHNRKSALLKTLTALTAQTFPLNNFEVIVVADGCNDGTTEMLEGLDSPLGLTIIEQVGNGAASARNSGASKATGSFLLFLDDDIEASPHLLEAHVLQLQRNPKRVVIGYLPTILEGQKGIFRTKLREWWEDMFIKMNQQGYRFSFRDLLSGNFSLSAKLFKEIGGFNINFKCQEDYELGLRLIQAGASFTFAPQALGYHHEITNLDRSLQRKYQEGKAAVQFAKEYPSIIYALPIISQFNSWYGRTYLKQLKYIFKWPSITDSLARWLRQYLNILEWLRMRGSWQRLLDKLMAYWYLRGVADASGNNEMLLTILKDAKANEGQGPFPLPFILDIKNGIDKAEIELDKYQPVSLTIKYGDYSIGYVDPKFGFENLRGGHLRTILAKSFADSLAHALTLDK